MKKKIVIEKDKMPSWCYDCDNFAWVYSDGSFGCWTCDICETVCDCQNIKPIKIVSTPLTNDKD